eukprot:1159086-Pelagomonas_calceolata.AAC.1
MATGNFHPMGAHMEGTGAYYGSCKQISCTLASYYKYEGMQACKLKASASIAAGHSRRLLQLHCSTTAGVPP